MPEHQIVFHPSGKAVEAPEGSTILVAAQKANIPIDAECGGVGTCRKCAVTVKGKFLYFGEETESLDTPFGGILACEAKVISNLEVWTEDKPESSMRILTECSAGSVEDLVPCVLVHEVVLPDSGGDPLANLNLLLERLDLPETLELTQELLDLLSKVSGKALVYVSDISGGLEILDIVSKDSGSRNLGVAVDVGTTTVAAQLLCLESGKVLETASELNAQLSIGADVLSRIDHAKEEGPKKGQELIVGTLNSLIGKLVGESHSRDDIRCVVASGNTTMQHLLVGENPAYLKKDPEQIATNDIQPPRAQTLGIHINENARVSLIPGIAAYVGGDITADLLACELHKKGELALLIDVGTNGEVVLGNSDFLTACSTSAGPAFEGGEMEFGTRAMDGAIEKVDISSSGEITFNTIGNKLPVGFCGSGLIDLVYSMFNSGIIDRSGHLAEDATGVRKGSNGLEFVVVPADKTGIGKTIVIREPELKSFIMTKGAIYSGCSTLLKTLGFNFNDLATLYIAGGFGRFLDLEKAMGIGLLPDIPKNRFKFIGNASLAGARLSALSKEKRDESRKILSGMTYIDLSTSKLFFEEYTGAMFLPHTDLSLFPSTSKNGSKSL